MIVNWPSKKSGYGQGGIFNKSRQLPPAPRVSLPTALRLTPFSVGKPAGGVLAGKMRFIFLFSSSFLKSSLKLINVRNVSEALSWNMKGRVQGRRKVKHCGSVGKGGMKAQHRGRCEPVIWAATLGASIPSSETIGRSPHFSIEQHDIKRWFLSIGTPTAGSLQVGFMLCSLVAGI